MAASWSSGNHTQEGQSSGRRGVKRGGVRLLVLLGFLLANLAGMIVLVVHSHFANRSVAMRLSEDVLASTDEQVQAELKAFLRTASSMTDFLAHLASESDPDKLKNETLMDRVASDLLRAHEHLAMCNIADTQGRFLMPKKMPDGSIDTKVIRIEDGQRTVLWTRRDPAGNVVSVEIDPNDPYDPRVRPWYRGAVKAGKLFWTGVYVFYTDKTPGITAAAPIYDKQQQLIGVLSLDIELDRISRFLSELKVGRHGRVVVASDDGTVVAHPDPARMMQVVNGQIEPARITDIGEPAIRRAFDQFRLEGPGRRMLAINGERYISLATPVPAELGQPWTVFVVVPEQDFVGIATAQSRSTLLLALTITLVSALLAVGTLVHGIRADRQALRAIERSRRLESHAVELAALACDSGTREARGPEDQSLSLDRLARIVGAPRVSWWRVDHESETLVLERVHADGVTHPGELSIRLAAVRRLTDAAASGRVVRIADAFRDPIAKGLEEYLRVADSRSVLMVPVKAAGGLLMFEHAGNKHRWTDDEVGFAETAARALTAGRGAGQSGSVSPVSDSTSPEGPTAAASVDVRRDAVRATASRSADALETRPTKPWEDAMVLAVMFAPKEDQHEDRQEPEHGEMEAAQRFMKTVCDAYECDLSCWSGDSCIAVLKPTPNASAAASRAVDLAVCVVEEFNACGPAWVPRVGIDAGPVTVCGRENGAAAPGVVGPSVRRAGLLARTASERGVQISGTVRALLRDSHTVFPRGRFLTRDLGDLEIHCIGHAPA